MWKNVGHLERSFYLDNNNKTLPKPLPFSQSIKKRAARQKVFSRTSRHTEIAVTSLHLCQQNPNGERGLPLHQASLKEATTPTSSASMLPKT